ncbi:MAG: amidohydrolase family protein [Acidobacteria bacterium]|nr:amidohydrolase family protein [Acidobacteriota bacterium]
MPVGTDCDPRARRRSRQQWRWLLAAAVVAALWFGDLRAQPAVDLLLVGGLVHDGSGQAPSRQDVGVVGERIGFVGDAAAAGLDAAVVVDVDGLMVTPGFIDMHSHAELTADYGRDALPFLHQGITTVAVGVDGAGTPDVAERFAGLEGRIGVNAFAYVGHGEVRRRVIGEDDRAPTPAELGQMQALVRRAMTEGAFGLSTGLFYVPGYYATTEEVIELARVAAEFDGIYDTHDRDLGASYRGVGYLPSIREAIRIGEEAGTRVIFSHFNAQGASNYGRAPEGARLIDEARARGVEVAAAQHVYTATQSSLVAYAIPRWASNGGREEMLERFRDPETVRRLDVETLEMLAIRGGAEKLLFADPRPELNGRTLAAVAAEWELPVPATVRRILAGGNAAVMNLDLYDIENTRYLARQAWMMTCTDGRPPSPAQNVTHPRVFGAFTRKLRRFVLDEGIIGMPFAIRSMTGLAADFLRLDDRGYLRAGAVADIAVFDGDRIRDRATYNQPRQYAEGTIHVLVNGRFAIRDGEATGALAGRPLRRPTRTGAGAP